MLGAAAAARGAGRAPSQHHRQPQQPGRVPLKPRRDDSQRMVIRVEARSSLLDDLPPARGCSVAEMVRIGARRFHVERGGQTGIARYTCPDEPAMEKILQ